MLIWVHSLRQEGGGRLLSFGKPLCPLPCLLVGRYGSTLIHEIKAGFSPCFHVPGQPILVLPYFRATAIWQLFWIVLWSCGQLGWPLSVIRAIPVLAVEKEMHGVLNGPDWPHGSLGQPFGAFDCDIGRPKPSSPCHGIPHEGWSGRENGQCPTAKTEGRMSIPQYFLDPAARLKAICKFIAIQIRFLLVPTRSPVQGCWTFVSAKYTDLGLQALTSRRALPSARSRRWRSPRMCQTCNGLRSSRFGLDGCKASCKAALVGVF